MPSPYSRDQLSPAMQERYGLGRRPVGPRIGVALLLAVFVGALVYVAVGITRSPIDARLITWEQPSPDRVDMTVDVRRPADAAVTCVLRAQDGDRVDVGYAVVDIPAGEATVQLTYALRTLAPAYNVELLGCATEGALSVPPPQFPPGVVPPEQPYE